MAQQDHCIEDLPAGTQWYREQVDGSIDIRRPIYRQVMGEPAAQVSIEACVALALNQMCCEMKSGKIYLFVPSPHRDDVAGRLSALKALSAVPSLFYTLYSWSDSDQREWSAMTPFEQLFHMSSRVQGIPDKFPILPFDINLDDTQRPQPEINAYKQAGLTVCIMPRPYVGYTADMREVCEIEEKEGWEEQERPVGATYVCRSGWSTFSQWRVDGVRGIVQQFDSICRDGREDCITFYKTLVETLIEAVAKANRAEEAEEVNNGGQDGLEEAG